jgi:hypothetical protein
MFDPDDLSLIATLAENPSLSQTEEFSAVLKQLKPQSRQLVKAIVQESAPSRPARASRRVRKTGKTAGAAKRAKSAAKRARRTSATRKQARAILQWARENRSRKK